MKVDRSVQEFTISDTLWERIEPLLPVRPKPVHPLGCHRGRTPDRKVLNGIFYVLRILRIANFTYCEPAVSGRRWM